MVALVHDNVAVLLYNIVDNVLAIQALNHGNINATRRFAASPANLAIPRKSVRKSRIFSSLVDLVSKTDGCPISEPRATPGILDLISKSFRSR
jgi:hypothetical protein